MTVAQNQELLQQGHELIASRKYAEAVQLLEQHNGKKNSAEIRALLGLAYFQQEHYADAAENYGRAASLVPDNPEWSHMFAQAEANAMAEVNEPVPPFSHFDADELLKPPVVPEGALPAAPRFRHKPGLLARLGRKIGNLGGAIVSVGMSGAISVTGKVLGYRDEVWTNWYRRPFFIGVITLGYMREQLNAHNLKDTYPEGELTGFAPRDMQPPPGVTHFRTADGTWNNLKNPKEGAAGTRFMRNVTDQAARPESSDELMSPNPREISRVLLTRTGPMKEVPFLNLLAASWIQFQNHDWVNHGEVLFNDIIEIPLPEDDPARKRYWQTKMFVGKTQPDPTRRVADEHTPVTYINEVTHWWDGSQVYGSDQATVDRLRSGVDGKLRLNEDGTLPLDEKGIEETGFVRNWWIGLSMWHTLFAREHNAICDRLKVAYPHWDDTRLFNVARLINAAVMAKIHSVEWTPAILPNHGLSDGMNANWYGLLTNFFRTNRDRKTLAPINIRNPEMGGVVGNPINAHGEPYGLTEEFVEVYRLHSLLPEELHLRRVDDPEDVEKLALPKTRQAGSHKLTVRMALGDLFYSFGTQLPGQLVLNNFPQFMQEMSIPGNPLFDMGAVDILRARERGIPRYNEFRRQLGLNPIRTFEDLTPDQEHIRLLKQVYGDQPEDVEKLDLMIGTLAEGYRPTGFGFGETMFQIFILNASRRLQADRFYTNSYNEETYTKEGLQWIDEADLKKVLLRHFPSLANTGLANVKNAFEPWDTDERLDPARHPLRAYDKDLKPDPWIGDSYRI